MGVKSLWSLLEPVGRPVPLETIEGKALAIDSSIWIYQFQATMRDKEGRALVNAHVLGFLRRICKLLFYGIRPVFVFDGGAPALKRNTIVERKKKKSGAAASHAKIAERLLAAQMRREALVLAQASKPPPSKGKQKVPSGPVVLDENTVYLEDITGSAVKTPKKKNEAPVSPPSSKKNRFHDHDPAPDPRLATEEELRAFIEEMRPEDFDVTSPAFRELPTEVQYEIVGDLRLKSRQTSYKRLQNMLRKTTTPLDFSREQIKNLQQRNALTQQLLMTTDSIGKAHITIPVRIASERNREYLLIKNEGVDGGWVLGIRDEGTRAKPIEIDQDTRVPVNDGDSESDMEMEEVSMYDSRIAIRKKNTVSQPVQRPARPQPLFDMDDEDELPRIRPPVSDDDDDPELALVIQASLDSQTKSSPSQSVFRSAEDPLGRSPLVTAPSARLRSYHDDEDLYASPSRLEMALSIAGAAPPRRTSGGYGPKPTQSSLFGTPSLLLPPRFPYIHHSALHPNKDGPGDVNTTRSLEEPPLSPFLKSAPPSPELALDNVHTPALSPSPPMIGDNRDDFTQTPRPRVSFDLLRASSHTPRSTVPSPAVHMPEEDSDASAIEWSRSPSPVGDLSANDLSAVEGRRENEESWDAAHEMDPHQEAGEFAKFISQMKGKDIDTVRVEIDEEIRELNRQKKAAIRDSEDITQHMISQIMLMLRLFGIPYITAPMEAEAQCAELVSLGLVDGIITDDSDVFLFGGMRVYKNMFNQSKTVECFLLSDLGRELGLERDTLVRLAYLLGSDYVEGLPGVGPVVAMELMKEFPGEDGLHKFKDWWTKVQSGRDREEDNNTKFRKRFVGLRPDVSHSVSPHTDESSSDGRKRSSGISIFRQNGQIPSLEMLTIIPTVDSSEEPFKWGMPDLDALRHFLQEELRWNATKVDDLLLPIIQKMSRRNQATAANRQGNLNAFLEVDSGAGSYAPRRRQAYASKRLQQVVSDFRKERAKQGRHTGSPTPSQDGDFAPEDETRPSKKRRITTASK
ncbi:PIN domain-like protein [Boletus edulis]|nr:PIN domain-like protein [Boletus edulis]